jgi:hypothetical protein
MGPKNCLTCEGEAGSFDAGSELADLELTPGFPGLFLAVTPF